MESARGNWVIIGSYHRCVGCVIRHDLQARTLEQKGMNYGERCSSGGTPKTFKKAHLALLEHLHDSIRRQTTPVWPPSALPDKITEHGTVILSFRYVDGPKSLRR